MKNRSSKYVVMILLGFLLGSCNNTVVLNDIVYQESFDIPSLDMLFVVDNSNSTAMDDKIEGIVGSIEHFVDSYVGNDENINFRIGLISMNVKSLEPSSELGQEKLSLGFNGNLVQSVISSDAYSSNQFENALDLIADYSVNNNVTNEQGLLASWLAVEDSKVGSTYYNSLNHDWYSSDHDLAVFIISEEDNDVDNVSEVLKALRNDKISYKGTRISFHAIVDEKTKCHVSTNSQIKSGAENYLKIVNLTGGVHMPLCEEQGKVAVENFPVFFEQVSNNLRSSFEFDLTVCPDTGSMNVYLDGEPQEKDVDYTISYTVSGNSTKKVNIYFKEGHYPQHGQHFKATYQKGVCPN